MSMSAALRREVRGRANDCCEYCQLPQSRFRLVAFHVEHVIARQHGGSDDALNLCLACHWCNLFKGPNLSSLHDGQLVRLFSPREDEWKDHFQLIDGAIIGLTPIGIATVNLLNMNDPDRVELRS
ncbi:MAG: HNH endonuclease [Pirellulaceae bacterium]|jgi:hypothetical protein|nr:HNH endonuclease [Pirellulaceae bacterium]